MDSCLRRIFLEALTVDLNFQDLPHSLAREIVFSGEAVLESWRRYLNPYARPA